MGISVDGYLFFGAPILEMEGDNEEGEGDIDLFDVTFAWQKAHEPKRPDDDSDCCTPEWDEWRKRRSEYIQKAGIDDAVSGDFDGNGQRYVYISALRFNSCWGEMVKIDALPQPTHDQLAALEEFLATSKLRHGEVGWYLTCLMG